jgi:hypothetical protein
MVFGNMVTTAAPRRLTRDPGTVKRSFTGVSDERPGRDFVAAYHPSDHRPLRETNPAVFEVFCGAAENLRTTTGYAGHGVYH